METTDAEDERMTMQPHVQPKIKEIAELIRRDGMIHRGEEKGQKANADLAKHYQKIEKDYHGHKGAVKAVRGLVKGTIDDAYDFMRTFVGLAEHFELFPEADLAGPGITPPSGKKPIPTEGDGFEATAEELAAQKGREKPVDGVTDKMIEKAAAKKASNVSPITSAAKHLAGGTKAEPASNDAGDVADADLAGNA